MKRSIWPGIWPLGLMLLTALVLWAEIGGYWRGTEAVKVVTVRCPDLANGCAVDVDGRQILFGTTGEPKPLAPFQVWVTTKGSAPMQKAEARFTMEGMDMGFNLYTLRADAQGVLRANVTLPICVTGRRDWNMILDVENLRLSVPFVTNL